MKSWEQRYMRLSSDFERMDIPSAFNEGLNGMCVGERRRITSDAAAFGLSESTIAISPVVICDIELITLTQDTDYAIFDLMDKNDVAGVMEIVENHIGVNAVDKYGSSALMAAVQGGSKMQMVVASLLNTWRPKVDVNFAKPSGHSALFYAATQDDSRGTAIMQALLRRGANPNVFLTQADTLGWTPLHFACKHGFLKHAALLLEFGANPLAETYDGKSVLDVAKDVPFSIRKKLASMLNEAVARIEEENEAPIVVAESQHSEL